MQPVDTIRCHIPINYASLSPDGRQVGGGGGERSRAGRARCSPCMTGLVQAPPLVLAQRLTGIVLAPCLQLVCVGDCNSTLVYGIAEGGYELASSMTGAQQLARSCHPTSCVPSIAGAPQRSAPAHSLEATANGHLHT